MSYFSYMACSCELPTGIFGLLPETVYSSYLEYRHSPDFVAPRRFTTGEPIDMDSEDGRKLERLEGEVIVYEKDADARWTRIEPYRPIVTHLNDEVFEASAEDMARHFTLPFLYNVSGEYEKYLCKYLPASERAEVYICWAGEEKWKFEGRRRVVDLERIVKGDLELPKFEPRKGKAFTVYLAPQKPLSCGDLEPVPYSIHVMRMIRGRGGASIPLTTLRDLGLW